MIRSGTPILRSAFAMMSARLIATQIGLAALVFALTVIWLRLPDSSAFSVVTTVIVGLLLLALASGGETVLVLRLCDRPLTLSRILRGAIALLACVVLWLLWNSVISTLESKEILLAGYLNSRFPASLRNAFSYQHINQGLEWIASMFRWIGVGFLAAAAYSVAASTQPRKAMRRVLFSVTYWLVLVAGCFFSSILTDHMMNWTPGHSLGIEMLSLILRLGIVTILDATILLSVLAVIAACIQRSDAAYDTPTGGPDNSQPLTAATP